MVFVSQNVQAAFLWERECVWVCVGMCSSCALPEASLTFQLKKTSHGMCSSTKSPSDFISVLRLNVLRVIKPYSGSEMFVAQTLEDWIYFFLPNKAKWSQLSILAKNKRNPLSQGPKGDFKEIQTNKIDSPHTISHFRLNQLHLCMRQSSNHKCGFLVET